MSGNYIVDDFKWNRMWYGHMDVRTSSGSYTKYYKADNGYWCNPIEITPEEHTKVAERYAEVFGR